MKLLLVFCFLSAQVWGKTLVTSTESYDEIFKKIQTLSAQGESHELLVVFDIDDTLLVIDSCVRNGKVVKGLAKLFHCPAAPAEVGLAQRILQLQEQGVSTIALTARGANLIRAAERELSRQQFFFKGVPFDQNFSLFKARKCRKTTVKCRPTELKFKDGVLYASGANKGWALDQFLVKTQSSYKTIVMVDDRKKNIKHIEKVFASDPNIFVQLFLYLKHR